MCEVFGTTGYINTAYTYFPYGSVISTGNTTQPIQWSSEFYDSELGLVYYKYRHYNPVDGRWIGRDFISEKLVHQLYIFSSNAPNFIMDIWGLMKYPQQPLIIPKNCLDCKKEVYIFIGGAMDSSKGPMYAAYEYTEIYERKDHATYAYYHWDVRDNILVNTINNYRKICPKSKVIIIGHSYGGDTAMDIAERLPSHQKIILVTLDPVSNYDLFNYSNRAPKSVEYWINVYVAKGPQDLLAFIPAAGQLFAGIGTLISGGGLSDTVASPGGKWGHESAANQNLRFDYYGEIDHGCGWCLLHDIPHNGIYSAYDTLQEYLEK